MTPNEQLNTTPVTTGSAGSNLSAAKATSTICLLAGIWFFISPWIYRAYTSANAWNCWIIGGFIVLFGIIRLSRPAYSTALGWCNMILGIWTFFSPWIYGYTSDQGRFINSLCVGVIIFVFSIASVRISRRTTVAPSIHATSR